MNARVAFMVWAGVGLCGTSLASSACIEQSCTDAGCASSEELSFEERDSRLAETEISACHEQHCWSGHLAAADLNPSTGFSQVNLRTDDPDIVPWERMTCSIDTHSQPGVATIAFYWWATEQTPIAVGDVLSVTFSDSAGNPVLTHSGSV